MFLCLIHSLQDNARWPLTWWIGKSGKNQEKIVFDQKVREMSGKFMKICQSQGKFRGKWNCFSKCLRKCWRRIFCFHILSGPAKNYISCPFLDIMLLINFTGLLATFTSLLVRPHFYRSLTCVHRRTHGLQTYVRRPWLIVSVNLIFIQCSCLIAPSAWLWVSIVKNPDAPSKLWTEDRWLVFTWLYSMC